MSNRYLDEMIAAASLYRDVQDTNKLQKTAEHVDNGGGLGRMVGIGAGVGGAMGLGAGGLFGIVDHPFSTSQNTLLNRLKHSGSTALKMGAGTALGSAALMGSLYGLGSYQQSHKKQAEENWRPDSYAHRLGWEDPRKAALRSAALTGLSKVANDDKEFDPSYARALGRSYLEGAAGNIVGGGLGLGLGGGLGYHYLKKNGIPTEVLRSGNVPDIMSKVVTHKGKDLVPGTIKRVAPLAIGLPVAGLIAGGVHGYRASMANQRQEQGINKEAAVYEALSQGYSLEQALYMLR